MGTGAAAGRQSRFGLRAARELQVCVIPLLSGTDGRVGETRLDSAPRSPQPHFGLVPRVRMVIEHRILVQGDDNSCETEWPE